MQSSITIQQKFISLLFSQGSTLFFNILRSFKELEIDGINFKFTILIKKILPNTYSFIFGVLLMYKIGQTMKNKHKLVNVSKFCMSVSVLENPLDRAIIDEIRIATKMKDSIFARSMK